MKKPGGQDIKTPERNQPGSTPGRSSKFYTKLNRKEIEMKTDTQKKSLEIAEENWLLEPESDTQEETPAQLTLEEIEEKTYSVFELMTEAEENGYSPSDVYDYFEDKYDASELLHCLYIGMKELDKRYTDLLFKYYKLERKLNENN